MSESRTKKALLNVNFQLFYELVSVICSFILPRLILSHFGSAYNGITQSISQFIGCVALLKSGIGSVTRAALYKPLAQKDYNAISEVVNATERFMRKIAVIFSVAVVCFAAVYPFIVKDSFEWLFTFTLFLILAVGTFAQYFFGLTYQMLLQADQKEYIISAVTIVSTIINTCVASLLILAGASIHIVKLGSATVFVLPPVFYMLYVRKKYKIDKNVAPNDKLISQRWDAFGHQLANFINLNTDIIIASLMFGVKEVSVYSVYYMVLNAVKKLVTTVATGTGAAFGNIIAKGQKELLKRRFEQYEILIFYLSTVFFTISAVMIIPFIKLYTAGITDVDYIREALAILICISEFFMCTKLPYEQLTFAAGHFADTKKMAYTEAVINISMSVLLCFFIGLNGIIVGTIVAAAYRTIVYNAYISENIIKRPAKSIFGKLLCVTLCVGVCIAVTHFLPTDEINSYFTWVLWAAASSVIVFAIVTPIMYVFYGNQFKELTKTALNLIRRH